MLILSKNMKNYNVLPVHYDFIIFAFVMAWFCIDTSQISWWTATSQQYLAIYQKPFADFQRVSTVILQATYIGCNITYCWRALKHNLPLFSLVAFCTLSVLWSLDIGQTTNTVVRILLLCVSVSLARERHGPLKIARLAAFIMGLLLIINIFSLAVPEVSYMTMEHEGAFRGFTNHKNMFGLICGLAIATFLVVISTPGRGHRGLDKLLYLFIAVALGLAVLSHSAASLAVCLIAILAEPFRRWIYNKQKPNIANAAIGIGLMVGLVIFVSGLLDIVLGLLGRDATFSQRSTIWNMVTRYILKEPMLGYGLNAFPLSKLLATDRLGGYLFVVGSTHNAYLDILLGIGGIGFLFYSGYIITIIRRAQNYVFNPVVFSPVLLVYLLSGLTESYGGIAAGLPFAILLMSSPDAYGPGRPLRLNTSKSRFTSEQKMARGSHSPYK